MEILTQLGINNTFWIQLAFFAISYFFLSQFLFKPYARNLKFRKKNTIDSIEDANKIISHADVLAIEYEDKVKSQNEKILHVYGQLKSEGVNEEHKLLTAARQRAEKVIAETHQKIQGELQAATQEIKKQVPEISKIAARRLLGRDL